MNRLSKALWDPNSWRLLLNSLKFFFCLFQTGRDDLSDFIQDVSRRVWHTWLLKTFSNSVRLYRTSSAFLARLIKTLKILAVYSKLFWTYYRLSKTHSDGFKILGPQNQAMTWKSTLPSRIFEDFPTVFWIYSKLFKHNKILEDFSSRLQDSLRRF